MHVFPPKADQIRTKPLFRELQAKLSDDESITVGTNYKPLDGSFPEPVDDKSLESSTSKHLIKTELWKSRLENMRKIKTPPWDMKQLEVVLNSLKKNKSMDPNGMVNEVFKNEYLGSDLKEALLTLFNEIKSSHFIPHFMTLENITTIFKSKGSRLDMNSDRGIFLLTIMKKILDKLIYNDNYKNIDQNMSDSNIGSRKRRNAKDHLFIIHGVINSVIRGKEDPIDLQIYDLEKAFDALWLEDCLNDLLIAPLNTITMTS